MLLSSLPHDAVKPSLLCVTAIGHQTNFPGNLSGGISSRSPNTITIDIINTTHKNTRVPSGEGIFSLRGMWGTEKKKLELYTDLCDVSSNCVNSRFGFTMWATLGEYPVDMPLSMATEADAHGVPRKKMTTPRIS